MERKVVCGMGYLRTTPFAALIAQVSCNLSMNPSMVRVTISMELFGEGELSDSGGIIDLVELMDCLKFSGIDLVRTNKCRKERDTGQKLSY